MNEPIMRRGLSPEGCKIRQKHQSSLLNEEFGVTSLPTQRKIEKNFLKENVMRLKEIQAKCRTQQSRPPSGSHPVKAIRPKITDILSQTTKETQEISYVKDREGSAHSDYYSLPDESHTDVERSLPDDSSKGAGDAGDLTCEAPANDMKIIEPSSPLVRKSSNVVLHQNSNLVPQNEASRPKHASVPSGPTDCFSHPLRYRQSKIGYVIEKIKKQKPACDTNCDILWREIEKQHKAFFSNQVSSRFNSSIDSTKRPVDLKKANFTKKKALASRSESLDRETYLKARTKFDLVPNYTFPLSIHPKSLTSIDQRSVGSGHHFPQTEPAERELQQSALQSSSLPNLTDVDRKIITPKQQSPFELTPGCLSPFSPHPVSSPTPSNEKKLSLPEDNLSHFKDRPHAEVDEGTSAKGSIHECGNDGGSISSEVRASMNEENLKTASSLNSVITKRDASIQTSSRVALPPHRTRLIRSKSSGNLRPLGDPPPSYRRGQIPNYLKIRKAEAQHRLEAASAVDPLCPPGHSPLADYERRNTLHLLKKGQADVMQQLSSLPLAQDTLRVRKMKQGLEAKLAQIEEGIKIFSQSKVYVVND